MSSHKRSTERGQSLVIVTIGLLAFLAFMALAIDGGYTWSQRRSAQSAADAGALAGTRELCISGDATAAQTAANDYAITRNGATSTSVNVSVASATVEVTANITFKTFFAHLLGRPEITAQAVAKAGCFLPGTAEGVLPIGWSCRPPLPGLSNNEDCQQQTITEDEFRARSPWSTYQPELYLVMDNFNFADDLDCGSGFIECDLNGDGEIDVLGAGDRSWLDLDGGGGGSDELRDWIVDGFAPELSIHTWVPGQTGTANNVFQAAATRVGDIVVLPVFDMYCIGDMTGTDCATRVHPNGTITVTDTIVPMNGANTNIHIISFSGFGISCVKAPGVAGTCPAWQKFMDLNAGIPTINNSFKSIEGYFIRGFVPGVGAGDPGIPDGGVYVLLLTK